MITDDMLVDETTHGSGLGGVQRMYRLPNGYQLSAINGSRFHAFPFAWDIAVINPDGDLTYETPLTNDVEVFCTDDDANEFIAKAKAWAEKILSARGTSEAEHLENSGGGKE